MEGLLAQTEFLNNRAVAFDVLCANVIEQVASAANQFQEAAPAGEILGVGFEMLREMGDALGEERDLYLGRPGVAFMFGVCLNYFLLAFFSSRH